jgi:hypothetical protein
VQVEQDEQAKAHYYITAAAKRKVDTPAVFLRQQNHSYFHLLYLL